MTKLKSIDVVPYNSEWIQWFEEEAVSINQVLQDNCLAIYHIGSTAIPELSAKPIIDMIVVVKDLQQSIIPLEGMGYKCKGELNIPFRIYFSKKGQRTFHIHMYEEDSPEIDLNILFRDYLRSHPESRREYADLKQELLLDKSSFERKQPLFSGYTLGKDHFIRKILQQAGFNRLRIMHCTHYKEWEVAKIYRQKYFFDKVPIPFAVEDLARKECASDRSVHKVHEDCEQISDDVQNFKSERYVSDPYTWTFEHKDHVHFVLYQGVEIIGYAHLQLWPEARAAMRIIVIDEPYRHQGFGSQFLQLCEKWLKRQRYKSLHVESSPEAYPFYKKLSYQEMPFDDPDDYESDPQDIPVGKYLI
jgi:GrpB-like predicted nucleotidyltransferase (UPF0157 family)/GNAT superfamily N-acetyltransferase